eukprot:m.64892 g.64892  ORF g.64892 m.64892 type:complete len:1185 (+) comp11686_c0_seq2:102-3656(+)
MKSSVCFMFMLPVTLASVKTLTDENFDSATNAEGADLWILEFYAPWCEACKSFKPMYDLTEATVLAKHGAGKVGFAAIDATAETGLAKKFKVDGYPKLVYLKDTNGPFYNYTGPLSVQGVFGLVEEVLDPSWKPPIDQVVPLTSSTFDDFIEDEERTMIEFFAPWCKHCKALEPEFIKASSKLATKGIKLGKVDCTEETELAERFNVTSYPVLMVFVNGEGRKYDGPRFAADIVKEMKASKKPAVILLESEYALTKLIKNDEHIIVAYVSSTDDDDFVLYETAASQSRPNFKCFVITDPKVIKPYKKHIKKDHITALRSKFLVSVKQKEAWSKSIKMSSLTDAESLVTWFQESSQTLVGQRTDRPLTIAGLPGPTLYYKSKFPLVIVFGDFDKTTPELRTESKRLLEQVAAVANKYTGVIPYDRSQIQRPVDEGLSFAIASNKEYQESQQAHGADDTDMDTVAIAYTTSMRSYVQSDDMSLEEFVEGVIDGSLEVFDAEDSKKKKNNKKKKTKKKKNAAKSKKKTSSEKKKAADEQGDVVLLTNTTYDSTVAESKGAAWMVYYHASWCEPCRKFTSIYADAAKMLKESLGRKKCVLAAVDSTSDKSTAAKHNVSQYPTLKVFKKGSPEYVYDGDFDAKSIVAYMKEFVKASWKPNFVFRAKSLPQLQDFIASQATGTLVHFHRPGLATSTHFSKELYKASRPLSKHDIKVAQIDIDANPDCAEQYRISSDDMGVIMFKSETEEKYVGKTRASDIVKELQVFVQGAALEIDMETVNKMSISDRHLVVGFFTDTSSAEFKKYTTLANSMHKELDFFYNTDPKIRNKMKRLIKKAREEEPQPASDGSITVFRSIFLCSQYDPRTVSASLATMDAAELEAFVKDTGNTLVGQRTYTNPIGGVIGPAKPYQTSVPIVIIYMDLDFSSTEARADAKALFEKVADVAVKHHNEILFAVSDETEFEKEIKLHGLEDRNDDYKAIIWWSLDEKKRDEAKRFVQPENMNLQNFVEKVLSGDSSINPFVISQSKTEAGFKLGKLNMVVAMDFMQDLKKENKEKDVLIHFHAPSLCAKCKQIHKTLGEAAKKLKKKKVIVAHVDATANEAPTVFQLDSSTLEDEEFRMFGRLFLMPKYSGILQPKPIRFKGFNVKSKKGKAGPSAKKIIEFVDKHTSAKKSGKKEKNKESRYMDEL